MGKNINPQSLAQIIIKKIEELGVLDRNKYIRGRAGELEQIGESIHGKAGKPPQEDLAYRARFAIRFVSYKEMGLLEKFLGKYKDRFKGSYTFGQHPIANQDTNMRLIAIDEPNGKPSEQRAALVSDLRTLANLLDKYAQQH